MRRFLHIRTFSMRLLAPFLVLIVLATLSSSAPAYWLTRRQLEQQAWNNVYNAQQSTLSLLQAEQLRLADLARLLAERPTLQQYVRTNALADLAPYLSDFQRQSDLDILIFCRNGRLLGGEEQYASLCTGRPPDSFAYIQDQPTLFASQLVLDGATNQPLGVATLGRWLDASFLSQLAANTGVAQSILRTDGARLASTLPDTVGTAATIPASATLPQAQLSLNGNTYLAVYTPLPSAVSQTHLVSEVALPVDNLIATENQALFILAASTALIAALAGLVGSWYVRQMAAPLQKLTDVAGQISEGNWMAPIPLFSGPAEVSTLATALQKSQASMLQVLDERSQARDWLNTLIQSISEGVVTLDGDGRVTFFSQGAETVSGWPAAETIGVHINDLFILAEHDNHQFLDLIPLTGSRRQIIIRTRTGKNMVLAITGAHLSPPHGTTAQVALVLRDVTQEEALRRLRSYFLANISHEFRTPLSTLTASMELLLDEQETFSLAEVRQLLKPTHVSLLSLQTLIDNLLESSGIEAGHFSLRRRRLHINQVITNAVNIARPLLERRKQTLSLAEPPQLPEMEADPARLTQALVNLLTNASKYSPIGKPIDLQVERQAAALRICVADRGSGIPAAERHNLFHSFVRLNAADEEQYGIGLGLYVVKTIVEAHGGQVGVSDRPGGGSIFWFELPYHHTPEKEEDR